MVNGNEEWKEEWRVQGWNEKGLEWGVLDLKFDGFIVTW